MSKVIVVKFGGTSLATAVRVRRAAARLKAHMRAGLMPVAVVSARGRTTDRIVAQLDQVCGCKPCGRERDRALATGETLSAALLAAALRNAGVEAVSLDACDAGIAAAGDFGNATPVTLTSDRIAQLAERGVVPVVAGFQALRADGERVTLGRGGSDTTAVFLAAQLGGACHIVTDVDGVYDTDPRTVAGAVRYDAMSHDALESLTRGGAVVVHPAAAGIARRHAVPLLIHHFTARPPVTCGTRVGGVA
ncbi:MAG TPA: hypothetical protein VF035_06680 [Longimicrobiales bacterium]